MWTLPFTTASSICACASHRIASRPEWIRPYATPLLAGQGESRCAFSSWNFFQNIIVSQTGRFRSSCIQQNRLISGTHLFSDLKTDKWNYHNAFFAAGMICPFTIYEGKKNRCKKKLKSSIERCAGGLFLDLNFCLLICFVFCFSFLAISLFVKTILSGLEWNRNVSTILHLGFLRADATRAGFLQWPHLFICVWNRHLVLTPFLFASREPNDLRPFFATTGWTGHSGSEI